MFVSSTFSDLKQERNALQRDVFPRLRKICAAHGCVFQAIDLRWGINEEAALDQQTMNICFTELERCKQVTPRLNFIILLGDRYGWIPLPSQIDACEFEEILTHVSESDKALLVWNENQPDGGGGWYRRDDNAVDAQYCLQPRKPILPKENSFKEIRKIQELESHEWTKTETRIRKILLGALNQLRWPKNDPRRVKYEYSATHQEILRGTYDLPENQGHVFAFLRKISNLPDLCTMLPDNNRARDFIDTNEDGLFDKPAHARLEFLKEHLSSLPSVSVKEYESLWSGKGISPTYIDKLCEDVYDSLSRVILEQIAELEETPPLTSEISTHLTFGDEHTKYFVGAQETLTDIAAYIAGTHTRINCRAPLMIYGPHGSGKTALLAQVLKRLSDVNGYFKGASAGKQLVIARFVGITPDSSHINGLLNSLCLEIKSALGIEHPQNVELTGSCIHFSAHSLPEQELLSPSTQAYHQRQETISLFRSLLATIPDNVSLVLCLDGLDNLDESHNAHLLHWLPAALKENVHIVVSALGREDAGACLASGEKKLPASNIIGIKLLTSKEADHLLNKWLIASQRKLQPNQRELILKNFCISNLPLYLRLGFNEAIRWQSHDNTPTISSSVDGIISNMLSRFERPENHGKTLLRHSLCYLYAARHGLSEHELIDVLSLDKKVMGDFQQRSPRSPKVSQLPVTVWLRLHADLQQHLMVRSHGGILTMGLAHRPIQQAALGYVKEVGSNIIHSLLANQFEGQPSASTVQTGVMNLRKWSELLWHLYKAQRWKELYDRLTLLLLRPEQIFSGVRVVPSIAEADFWKYWTKMEKYSGLSLNFALGPVIANPKDYNLAALSSVVHILRERRCLPDAHAILDFMIDRYSELGKKRELACMMGEKASLWYFEHQMDAALEALNEEESICRSISDDQLLAACLLFRGVILEAFGRIGEAYRLYHEQEQRFQKLNDYSGVAACLSNRATIMMKKGRMREALDLFHECESIERDIGEESSYAKTIYNRGCALHTMHMHGTPGMLLAAEEAFEDAEQIFRDLGNMEGVSGCLGKRAAIAEDDGRPEDALPLLEEQTMICQNTNYDEGILRSMGNRARILGLVLNDPDHGEELAQETLALATLYDLPKYVDWMEKVRFEIRKLRGNYRG